MLDDIQRLRNNPPLLELLSYYANLGREGWHHRLMHMENVNSSELSKLHGQLIACSWADQNTGHYPCCYKVTPAGLRAMEQVLSGADDDDWEPHPVKEAA